MDKFVAGSIIAECKHVVFISHFILRIVILWLICIYMFSSRDHCSSRSIHIRAHGHISSYVDPQLCDNSRRQPLFNKIIK